MSFAALHKLVAYLVAGLGLAAISIGDVLDVTTEAAMAIGFALSAFVEGRRLHDPGWSRGWTIAVLAFFALQVARAMLGEPILPLVLEATAALQISRLMNRRGAREYQQIAALALLHLIAATVLSTELAYGFVFLGFVVAAPWMLALSHLRAEIEAQQRPEPERERTIERVLASKRVVGPRFLAGTAALALPLFLLTGVLFVAFPRVGFGFLSFGQESGQRTSGFGSNVELGDFGVIRTDPTVVLRVTPPDLGANPPPLRSIRMRGTSFDHYDGRRWTRSRDLRAEGVGRIGAVYPVPVRMPSPQRDRRWTIVLDALDEPVIFVPPGTVAIEVPPHIRSGTEIGRSILHTPGVDLRYGDADGLGLRYVAWTSDDPSERERGRETLDPEEARRYLQVPPGHERVAALARRWTRGASDDAQRARMLLARLRDSGEYRYSLSMPRLDGRTPLDVFLFDAKRGHCEYFATALAIQLRTLGIPARNVAGFLGGRLNRYGGYYAISQGDAHSWVEAWLPGRGWVTLDPTPPSREAIATDGGALSTLREIADALRTRWTQHVVGYDLRSQVGVFRSIRRWLAPRAPGRAEPNASSPDGEALGHRSWSWVWPLVGVLAASAVALVLVRRQRRARESDPAARRATRLYRALDQALARLGHARPASRAPLEHVEALEQSAFPHVGLVREITARYLEARYGGKPLDAEELARLLEAVASLRRRR